MGTYPRLRRKRDTHTCEKTRKGYEKAGSQWSEIEPLVTFNCLCRKETPGAEKRVTVSASQFVIFIGGAGRVEKLQQHRYDAVMAQLLRCWC